MTRCEIAMRFVAAKSMAHRQATGFASDTFHPRRSRKSAYLAVCCATGIDDVQKDIGIAQIIQERIPSPAALQPWLSRTCPISPQN